MHRLEGTGSTQNTGGSEGNINKWTQLSPSLNIEQTSQKWWSPPRSVRHLHCHAAIKTINDSYLKRHQAEEHRSQWRPAHNHYRAADEMDDLRQLVRAGWMWGGGGRGWRLLLFTPKLDSNWLPVWGKKSGFKTSFSFFSHPSSLASCSQCFSTEGKKRNAPTQKLGGQFSPMCWNLMSPRFAPILSDTAWKAPACVASTGQDVTQPIIVLWEEKGRSHSQDLVAT